MMDLDIPERLIPVRDKIDKFVRERVDPLTDEYYEQINVGDRWALNDRQTEILDGLKDQARDAGLWNFFLPESQGGAGPVTLCAAGMHPFGCSWAHECHTLKDKKDIQKPYHLPCIAQAGMTTLNPSLSTQSHDCFRKESEGGRSRWGNVRWV